MTVVRARGAWYPWASPGPPWPASHVEFLLMDVVLSKDFQGDSQERNLGTWSKHHFYLAPLKCIFYFIVLEPN